MLTGTSPKVSIIMPAYNRAALILDTIESIRNQSYSNWELIIVDDGSSDNSGELITALSDERIRFHPVGRCGIVGRLKNIGLQKASGELIAFMDSDDLWEKTKLEKQVKALDQYPEAGFSLTGGYNFRVPGQPVEYFNKKREGITYGDMFIAFFKSEVPAFIQTLMARKECIAAAGHFGESKSFSDVEFILNLARSCKAVVLYEPLLFRRLHDSNDSQIHWEQRYHEGAGMIRSYKESLPGKIYNSALFKLYIRFGEEWLGYRDRKKAVINFLKAWQYKPLSIVPFKKTVKALLPLKK